MLTSKRIELEAARWLVRQRAGSLSEQEKAELDEWLAVSSRHVGAYTRARAASIHIDRVIALSGKHGAQSEGTTRLEHPDRRWFVAASVAALVTAAGTFGWSVSRNHADTYATKIGQIHEVSLSDGSRMVLNTDSQAIVRFGHTQREVRLERGEMMFEVVKDLTRPFVVNTDALSVKAIGTAFSVRRGNDDVEVLVTEGLVEVRRLGDSDPISPRRVAAHQRLIVSKAGPDRVEPISPDKSERVLAWRAGVVAFDGEPLGEAIAELNRYNRLKIVLDDRQLAARPIVGIFRTTDVETFISAVAPAFGADVERQGDLIRLVRNAEPP